MLVLVAALAENGCIGVGGKLPWHIPADLKHFQNVTRGRIVLMGRKTWESLPASARPLPDRRNIVITTQTAYAVPPGVERFESIDAALAAHAGLDEDIMVIGGADIYRQIIDRADRLLLTHVHQRVEGDAFFPVVDAARWRVVSREAHETADGVKFEFVEYECAN